MIMGNVFLWFNLFLFLYRGYCLPRPCFLWTEYVVWFVFDATCLFCRCMFVIKVVVVRMVFLFRGAFGQMFRVRNTNGEGVIDSHRVITCENA